ncbi:hypothetical protein VTN77DRAFT_1572 [Rasamsonia byssochlamydoides]|uniref:uncharacterized protein n=1 Tax=Rasamsonia byssochlamydoides TaxID=89139 RepID=UPI003742E1DC
MEPCSRVLHDVVGFCVPVGVSRTDGRCRRHPQRANGSCSREEFFVLPQTHRHPEVWSETFLSSSSSPRKHREKKFRAPHRE